jgi:hypothetical protein
MERYPQPINQPTSQSQTKQPKAENKIKINDDFFWYMHTRCYDAELLFQKVKGKREKEVLKTPRYYPRLNPINS